MIVANKILTLTSTSRRELIDITEDVLDFADQQKVANGTCTVSVPHATAAIIANENENGLRHDLLAKIENLFPQSGRYAHNAIDDNADSHVAAAFLGHSTTFPIVNGRLIRGTWQNVFLVELDGPRTRRDVYIQIMGEH
jgi:secondary thiamine-phosphate synthase enzyme